MGPMGVPETIIAILIFLLYTGLLAAVVFVVWTVHRIRHGMDEIRALLADIRARLDDRAAG
jgi:hypothetical protein